MGEGSTRKKGNHSLKGISIKWRLISSILPVVLVGLLVLAYVTSATSRRMILERTDLQMDATLGEYTENLGGKLGVIRSAAEMLALNIGTQYENMNLEEIRGTVTDAISGNAMVFGCGLWFEPNVYEKGEKYYGPYWRKDSQGSGEIVEDWGYSNQDYDYFSQEYYTLAKESTSGAAFTDTYYDEALGTAMVTCTAPMVDKGGAYVGCLTVDLMLTEIQEFLQSAAIGETGGLSLFDGSFRYICHPKIETAAADGLTMDDSVELGEWIGKVKTEASGIHGEFPWDGKTRILYWRTVPDIGWRMLLTIEEPEILEDINRMLGITAVIGVLVMLLCGCIIIWQAGSIAKALLHVQDFARKLAEGDFTVEKLHTRRKDELGAMADSLDRMFENNAGVIKNIGENSGRVNKSSVRLSETSTDLLARFEEVASAMERVNDAMTSTGAATE